MHNDTCPITLELLSNLSTNKVFIHADVGFDMVTLYEYLVTAPKFVNPLNRVPFTMTDLERLETQMKDVYGNDCILYKNDSEEEGEQSHEEEDQESSADDDDYDADDNIICSHTDWFNENELVSRLNTHIVEAGPGSNARLIRLRVDIDMDDIATREETAPCLDTAREEKEAEEEEEDDFSNLSLDALPPRRTFQSLTDMYKDDNRENRMGEQLSLLQYLEYDAMAILVQMMDMSDDQNFHRFVWQHTSLDVMGAVTSYIAEGIEVEIEGGDVVTRITEPSPSLTTDYDLQVEYTSCWEVYRMLIIETLERRYLTIARDVLSVGVNDFRALLTAHRAHVRQRAVENEVNYDPILDMLVRVADELHGRR